MQKEVCIAMVLETWELHHTALACVRHLLRACLLCYNMMEVKWTCVREGFSGRVDWNPLSPQLMYSSNDRIKALAVAEPLGSVTSLGPTSHYCLCGALSLFFLSREARQEFDAKNCSVFFGLRVCCWWLPRLWQCVSFPSAGDAQVKQFKRERIGIGSAVEIPIHVLPALLLWACEEAEHHGRGRWLIHSSQGTQNQEKAEDMIHPLDRPHFLPHCP